MSDPTDYRSALATGDAFRERLRALPTPIVVVTVADVEGATGATIGSFASVSLEPPLVSFNVSSGTNLHDAVSRADKVAVHLLRSEQHEMALAFSQPNLTGAAKLSAFPHDVEVGGLPILKGSLGVFICRPVSRFEAGDSLLVVAEVEEIRSGAPGTPLLYYQRAYRGVELGDAD